MTVPPQPSTPPAAPGPYNTRTRNSGDFNPTPDITMPRSAPAAAPAPGTGGGRKGLPGADFMSNEDIRAFCEYLRKDARNRATERAMDADHLEAVLRTIPDAGGSLGGARARARRVSRWLKKVAAAEKAIQKYSASIYASFEREYDAELRQIGRGRVQHKNHRAPFGWKS